MTPSGSNSKYDMTRSRDSCSNVTPQAAPGHTHTLPQRQHQISAGFHRNVDEIVKVESILARSSILKLVGRGCLRDRSFDAEVEWARQ